MQTVVGIDPGIRGGLAQIALGHGWRFVDCAYVPVCDVGKSKVIERIDPLAYAKILKAWKPAVVVIEKVQPMPSVQTDENDERVPMPAGSAFSFGWNTGTLWAVAVALGYPVETVMPAVWKRRAGLLSPGSETPTEAKRRSRLAAASEWPDAPLDKAGSHAIAEALFIARHGVSLQPGLV